MYSFTTLLQNINFKLPTKIILMNATDFFCGLLAGWAQVLVGQPFDFIKVKIQTAKQPSFSSIEIAKDIYRTYGLSGFYRGSSSLFFGFACTIGTEFLVLQWAKRQLYFRDSSRPKEYDPSKLSMWQITAAGGVVGSVVSFIYCPVEYTKIQRQLSSNLKLSSLGLLFRELITNGISNIYRGYWATFMRETYGSMIYYATYEGCVRMASRQREKASNWAFLGAGGAAGLCYHLFTYPVDTIKSNMQAGLGWGDAVRNSLMMSKLHGYKVVLLRAILVNSCSFWVYEQAQKYVYAFNNYYYSMY